MVIDIFAFFFCFVFYFPCFLILFFLKNLFCFLKDWLFFLFYFFAPCTILEIMHFIFYSSSDYLYIFNMHAWLKRQYEWNQIVHLLQNNKLLIEQFNSGYIPILCLLSNFRDLLLTNFPIFYNYYSSYYLHLLIRFIAAYQRFSLTLVDCILSFH